MICPYCGKENHGDLVVCEFCTAPLQGQPAEQMPNVQPAKLAVDSDLDYELPESLRNVADQMQQQNLVVHRWRGFHITHSGMCSHRLGRISLFRRPVTI